jgi:hypothetical protein
VSLRQTGLEFVTKNYAAFMGQMGTANKSVLGFQSSIDRFRTTSFRGFDVKNLIPDQLLSRMGAFGDQLKGLTGQLGSVAQPVQAATSGLDQFDVSLTQTASKLNLTAVAATVALTALLALGMRGAAMPGMIEAFDVGARHAGTLANVLLQDLREAARGTVSDLTLVRNANLALAGTQPALAKALGSGGLAGLMEIARSEARATGLSVQYMFESLVLGIKRTSPRLVDNTGLVLKVGEANEKYAKSIGKTVEQLTAEEKQIALLNATLEAGKGAVESYGHTALQASERIARIHASITNALDRAALSIQPLFTMILAFGETVVSAVLAPLSLILPVVYALTNAIAGPLTAAWERVTGILSNTFAPVADLIHRWLVVLIGVIKGFGLAWDWLLKQVTNILGPFGSVIKTYLLEPLSKMLDPVTFAKAGGIAFGALAEGILWAANALIFPAIYLIAKGIADLLCGSSPPPKGPLHYIDQGGAATMLAWLEGFTGVSLTSVEDMAKRVDEELGAIRFMSHSMVEAALKKLDDAIQPFIDNLEIVKAKFEAILEPLRVLQDALERKLNRALEKFFKGEISEQAVRAIDRQTEALQDQMSLFEDMSLEAEYQLALMKSQQALQRALLEIQLRRTESAEKEKKTKKAKEEKVPKGKEPTGKAETPEEAGGYELPVLGGDAVQAFLGVTDEEIKKMFADMGAAFTEGFEMTGAAGQLKTAQSYLEKIGAETERIKKSPPFQWLGDQFETIFGAGGKLLTIIDGFKGDIEKKFEDIWGDGGSLRTIVDGFWAYLALTTPGGLALAFGPLAKGLLDNIEIPFSITFGMDGTISAIVQGFIASLAGHFSINGDLYDAIKPTSRVLILTASLPFKHVFDPTAGGIADVLNGFISFLSGEFAYATDAPLWTALANIAPILRVTVRSPFDTMFANWGEINAIIRGWIAYLTGVFDFATTSDLWKALEGVDLVLKMAIRLPFITMFNADFGDLKTIVQGFLDFMNTVFENSQTGLFASTMGVVADIFKTFLLDPAVTALNIWVDLFVGALNMIVLAWNSLVAPLVGGASLVGLGSLMQGIQMIPLDPSAYHIVAPRRQWGGDVLGGMPYVVGERGWELFRPNVPGYVYSHQESMRMMDRLMSRITYPQAALPAPHTQYIPAPSGASSTDNRRYSTFNANLQTARDNPQNIRMRLAAVEAWVVGSSHLH